MRIKNKEIHRRRHRKEQKIKDAARETRAQFSGEKKPAAPKPAAEKAAPKPKAAAAPKKTAEAKAPAAKKPAAKKKTEE